MHFSEAKGFSVFCYKDSSCAAFLSRRASRKTPWKTRKRLLTDQLTILFMCFFITIILIAILISGLWSNQIIHIIRRQVLYAAVWCKNQFHRDKQRYSALCLQQNLLQRNPSRSASFLKSKEFRAIPCKHTYRGACVAILLQRASRNSSDGQKKTVHNGCCNS